MESEVLKISHLTKKYKNITILNNINLSFEKGKVYGLIGLNGAGKTTLMKLIAGFLKPSEGKITLFGGSTEKELREQRKRIGCFIESPGILDDMTAEENMNLHRIIKGIPNEEIIDELLETVNLKEVKNKKVKNYSLGTRQRLGIAISLIGNPEFLILDEPINGLDPVAIIEMRNMIKDLTQKRHITILISSHILNELYQIATDYIIIHKGEIKKIIKSEEIDEKCRRYILLTSNETEKMAYVIEKYLKTSNYVVMPNKSIKLYDFIDEREKIARAFMNEKILITNISCEGDSLEDYFINIIGDKNV